MDETTASFLPFHAINEFMRDDYRLEVVRAALFSLPELSAAQRDPIDRLTKKLVQIPGFRNSLKAPTAMRLKPSVDAFGKSPQMVAAILSAWVASRPELARQVYDLLVERKWDVLPVETDRSRLPGFLPVWPKGEDFELVYSAYKENNPSNADSQDDVSLMVVWISGRLPYSSEEDQT